MEVLTEAQHRALAFVGAANAGGYGPTGKELGRWLSSPERRRSGGTIQELGLMMGHQMRSYLGDIVGSVESTAEHLEHLGWVTSAHTLWLTPLGKALLRSAEIDEASQPSVLVLDNEDPLAYVQLLGMLSGVTGALLVDPYLDAGELLDLIEFTGVERILMGDKDRGKRTRVAAFLSKAPDPGVEVRSCSGLHDRMIIAGDGRVWTIGASLNTVSKRKSPTTLTPMPTEAAESLRKLAEGQWAGASPLVQPALEAGPAAETATGDDSVGDTASDEDS